MKTDYPKAMLVFIRIPELEGEPTNPALLMNGFAGGLLSDLISVALSAGDLLTEPVRNGPTPLLGGLWFDVKDVRTAADIAWPILQRNMLDSWAIIFGFDGRELLWQSIYPRAGIGLLHEHLAAGAKARQSAAEEAYARELRRGKGLGLLAPGGEAEARNERRRR